MTKNNEENGKGHKLIPSQKQGIMKPWNYRKLSRIKYWHNIVQEDQIGQLWFDLEGALDTEDSKMMLEASLADTINMTGLYTSGHHLPDEFIKILLGISLAPGGRAQIIYENFTSYGV